VCQLALCRVQKRPRLVLPTHLIDLLQLLVGRLLVVSVRKPLVELSRVVIVLLFVAISHSPEKLLEYPPGIELAIATVISGAEKYPVCKQVGQFVSVLGVFVCALADTESLLLLDLSVSLVMEQIDCLEVRVKLAEITGSKFFNDYEEKLGCKPVYIADIRFRCFKEAREHMSGSCT